MYVRPSCFSEVRSQKEEERFLNFKNSCSAMESFLRSEQRRTLQLSLLSSVLFSLGSTFLVLYIYAVYRTDGGQDLLQAKAPKILVLLGFGFLGLHTLPEFYLDCTTRCSEHGRLGENQNLNVANSSFFLVACIFQGVAYWFHLQESADSDLDLFVTLSLISSILWVLSAVATFEARGCCFACCSGPCPDQLDHMANNIYMASTVVWLSAALQLHEDSGMANFLQDTVFWMWALIGIFYLAADLQRYSQLSAMLPPVDPQPLKPVMSELSELEQAIELKRYASV